VAGHGATKKAMGPLSMWSRVVEIFMANPETLMQPGRPLLPCPADNGRP
jgi:hypothetical protein